jgi:hypothetical protein
MNSDQALAYTALALEKCDFGLLDIAKVQIELIYLIHTIDENKVEKKASDIIKWSTNAYKESVAWMYNEPTI